MSESVLRLVMSSWARWRRAIQLTGIILLVWILSQLDLGHVATTLMATDMGYLALYVALFITAMVLRAMRLRWIVMRQGYGLGLGSAYKITVEASLLGSVTPARAGEVTKVFALSHLGVPAGLGLAAVVLERAFDLLVFATLAVGGVLYFAGIFPQAMHALMYLAGALAAAGLSLYIFRGVASGAITRFLAWLADKWTGARAFLDGGHLKNGLRILSDTWGVMFAYSCLVGAFGLIEAYCLANALSIKVDFVHLIFSYSVASLVALLPVSFNGLGTREAAYVYLLGLAAVKPEPATLFSLLDGIVLPLMVIAILSIPVWKHAGRLIAAGRYVE